MSGREGHAPHEDGSGNAFVVAFAEDGRAVALLVRSNGEVSLVDEEVEFRALCLDGISFPAG
jgi:hypothetical protein